PPKFCCGAVVSPCSDPIEPQIIKMENKIQAGAEFFQTQLVFEVDKFAEFMNKVKNYKVPVMAGITILKSVGMAKFMNANVSGVFVPDNLIEELKKDKEKTKSGQTGIEIAARLIKELKGLCQGIHIMSLGWDRHIPSVLEKAGL
ncbi:unnamed protein product, partial [marine sediment metagenome]